MREGSIYERELDSGMEIVVYPMLFNDRVCLGFVGDEGYERGWCYPKGIAVEMAEEWDGEGDPPGPWIKEAGTHRYGPGSSE